MFVRDKDLGRGRGGGDERARVLQLAKEQRLARSQLREHDAVARRLQAFVRGRLAARRFRAALRDTIRRKLADVARLQELLQQPALALPLPALFDMLRELLFGYRSAAVGSDWAMVEQLGALFMNAVRTDAGAALRTAVESDARSRWLLQRLVDVSVQSSSSSALFVLVHELTDASDELLQYALTGTLTVVANETPRFCTTTLFSAVPRRTLAQVARAQLTQSRSRPPGTATPTATATAQSNAIIDLLVRFLRRSSPSQAAFASAVVTDVLSVPLLPEIVAPAHLLPLTEAPVWDALVRAATSTQLLTAALPPAPVAGIASSTWLLGNVLSLATLVVGDSKPTALVLAETHALTALLRVVSPETFAANGVAVAWTKVSASHSVPVVFPDALNTQLELLLRDRFVRASADKLLWFRASRLQSTLVTARPTPMFPTAPSLAEQYGFGDIASEASLASSFSSTWKKVKALGKPGWARGLLEKAGLRRKPRNDFENSRGLLNTSGSARTLAATGRPSGTDAKPSAQRQLSERQMGGGEPFPLENLKAFASLWATFLFRWGQQSGQIQAHGMKLLNTLAFYQCANHDSDSDSDSGRTSLVRFLWCVLQETRDFEGFAKTVDLVRAKDSDAYICTLALFCLTYHHLLVVLDDEEMYDDEFPLPLFQVERVVVSLKRALHAAYWIHGSAPASSSSSEASVEPAAAAFGFGKFVVDGATNLLRDLYNRCSRHPFCNVTSWIIPDMDSNELIDEVLRGTPRANKLIASMPYLLPFPDRVKLFQRLVKADKATHQGGGSAVYRIRIRRGLVLEDGLAKLNSIQSNLKKRLNVVFVNAAGREEVGIDAGGLFKEFWLDLSNLAFDLEYGLFLSTTGDQLLYPNPFSASGHFARESDHLTLFQFVGRILGKALYEGIVVEPKFAHFFLSKLLHSFNHLNDLPSLDPDIYRNLMFLKTYEGDIEDLGLTHTIVQDVFGDQKEVELLPGGGDIPVTSQNKTRYIHLVANYYLNTQIRAQSAAFRSGLNDLIDVRWLQLFNEPELQVLISGKSGQLDVADLRSHTAYAGGYFAMDKRVAWLWQALASFSPAEQAAFLRFATSCQRAPSLGFSSLTPPFCVQKVSVRSDDELLPSSSTCFNTLKLPTYSSYKVLRVKLLLSITSGAGFEMT